MLLYARITVIGTAQIGTTNIPWGELEETVFPPIPHRGCWLFQFGVNSSNAGKLSQGGSPWNCWAKIYLDTWGHYDMEMLSELLALCVGNPPVTGGSPSEMVSKCHGALMSSLSLAGQSVEQTVDLSMIWDAWMLMWHHGIHHWCEDS